jgi:hypothetical protein
MRLTNELRGRTKATHGASGAQFLSARGGKPQSRHGPFQRMLGAAAANSKTLFMNRCLKVN